MECLSLNNLYKTFIVNSFFVFLIFLLVFSLLFIHICIIVSVPIIQTYDGLVFDNRIIIYESIEYVFETAYIYKSREEYVVPCDITKIEIIDDNCTVLYWTAKDQAEVNKEQWSGTINIDIEKESVALLELILGTEKRYINKDRI